MMHRLFPTAGDVVAAVGWLLLGTTVAVAYVGSLRARRRRDDARYSLADRYARHRPRR